MSTDMMDEAREIVVELRSVAVPERAEQEKRYLKSDLVHLGASMPKIAWVSKAFIRGHRDLSHDGLIALIESLWDTGIHEARMVVVDLLDGYPKLLTSDDVFILEQILREAKTWAIVDPVAISVVGALVERDPELVTTLDRWTKDPDFWIRRSALLALLRPLRRGEGDFARFSRYADGMLHEKEFFIRKAIGWVLRETSKRRPDLVFEWMEPRAARASGVTFREAVKYLSEDQREILLAGRTKDR